MCPCMCTPPFNHQWKLATVNHAAMNIGTHISVLSPCSQLFKFILGSGIAGLLLLFSYRPAQLFCDPMDCSPPRLLCPWSFPGKNTGVGCPCLLQGIFPIQGSNLSPALASGFFTTAPSNWSENISVVSWFIEKLSVLWTWSLLCFYKFSWILLKLLSFEKIIRILTGMYWGGSLMANLWIGKMELKRSFWSTQETHTQDPGTEMIIVFSFSPFFFWYKGINCGYVEKWRINNFW